MKILRNIIRTPDGTLLESKTVHDYVTHKDENGETYFNDGGKAYLRRSVNIEPYEDLTIYDTDEIEKIREHFLWGTYGKTGNEKLQYKKLCDMSNMHIKAIIVDNFSPEHVLNIFKREIQYRNTNNISISD